MASNHYVVVNSARREREAQKRQRELERQAIAAAKLSERQKAMWEADTYANKLEVLLSVHKARGEKWDWCAVAAALQPIRPSNLCFHLSRAQQNTLLQSTGDQQTEKAAILLAEEQDKNEFSEATQKFKSETKEWESLVALGRRIVAGDPQAYLDAIAEIDPLAELSEYGASAKFKFHNAQTLSCELSVSDTGAVPAESKTLTSTGKLSIKPVPRARFHEIYQDYICSCMLRVVRESFALLPIETLIVTAWTSLVEVGTAPVLSAAFTRTGVERLDFESLDPSDAVEVFTHRGAFKASRKAGAFQAITPLVPADLPSKAAPDNADMSELRSRVADLRKALSADLSKLKSTSSADDQ